MHEIPLPSFRGLTTKSFGSTYLNAFSPSGAWRKRCARRSVARRQHQTRRISGHLDRGEDRSRFAKNYRHPRFGLVFGPCRSGDRPAGHRWHRSKIDAGDGFPFLHADFAIAFVVDDAGGKVAGCGYGDGWPVQSSPFPSRHSLTLKEQNGSHE